MNGTSAPAVEAVGGPRSMPRVARPRPSALAYAYLAVGAVVSATYFLFEGQAREFVYEAVAASCVVAILVGVRRYQPASKLPWYLLAGGNALWLVGDVVWSWYPILADRELPFPSPADAAYLLAYPLMMVAIALIVRTRGRELRRDGWIDAAIVGVVAGILVWEIALEDYVMDGFTFAEAVNVAYPLMDAILIGFLARLLFARGPRTPAFGLLVASMVIVLAADILYAREVAADSWTFDEALNAGWLAGYLLLGAAALHPSMHKITEGSERRGQALTRGRSMVLAVLVALPILDVVISERLDANDAHADVALGMLLVIGMVFYRLSSLIGAFERQAVEVADLHRERGYVLDEITRAIEDERTRLAVELHDGPIQRLTGYGMRAYVGVRKLRGGDQAAAAGTLEGIGDGLNAEVRGLRALMSQLRPPVLSERGLVDALRDHADAIASERGIVTAVEGPPDLRLGPDVETGLYRIAQEALMNAIRHSGAGRVDVRVETNDGRVRLTVRDDGSGFDAAERQRHDEGHHFGLLAMRERASMLHGGLRIASVAGEGTTVTVDAPLGVQP